MKDNATELVIANLLEDCQKSDDKDSKERENYIKSLLEEINPEQEIQRSLRREREQKRSRTCDTPEVVEFVKHIDLCNASAEEDEYKVYVPVLDDPQYWKNSFYHLLKLVTVFVILMVSIPIVVFSFVPDRPIEAVVYDALTIFPLDTDQQVNVHAGEFGPKIEYIEVEAKVPAKKAKKAKRVRRKRVAKKTKKQYQIKFDDSAFKGDQF